ncbi:MAG TPA: DNA alkylation repair protein [Thermoanaerobaculia bacterium]|nr:DNA alkylation repair protein [Thermoanaerobaculia bacterium]
MTVPQVREFVRATKPTFAGALQLLRSKFHEERLAGLIALVKLHEKGDAAIRKRIFETYLANTDRINNWDLVDTSAPQIVGAHLLDRDRTILRRLARSKKLWERRIAMVATQRLIRSGEVATTMQIAAMLIEDEHDLIHKAVGWMLREAGKEDKAALIAFLAEHAATMPRTALRYAIEKFPAPERKRWLGAKDE